MAVAYPQAKIQARLVTVELSSCVRLSWDHHRQTPLGCIPAKSRFCDGQEFGVLYCAKDFATAFLETVVRDQLKGRMQRIIPYGEIVSRCVFEIATVAGANLLLLDLRDTGCSDIGVSTDAVNAVSHQSGRALALAVHDQHLDIDGILYSSRLTNKDNYAIFDRAIHKLTSAQSTDLKDHRDLPDVLRERNISLF